ncbi:MAG TPA: lactate utilization protein, partial [Firmicutes bacterium]|nr:lactate utilization protein [Bacillota bacterium]
MSRTQAPTNLKQRFGQALEDDFLRSAVKFTADSLRGKKQTSIEAVENWEAWRDRGRQVREHTLAHLDFYLDQFARQAEAKGTQVHFAGDAAEAVRLFLQIVQNNNAKRVAKSKSMVSEEIRLNQHLEAAEVECVETDLGEWIIQLAGETPSHLIIPAIHKTRAQIQALFEQRGRCALTPDTAVLAGFARRTLREVFTHADIGMTGCNFAIAESGAVVVFTNEGNGRMVATLPKTHVVMMGMERIIPTLADLEVMAHLLPRSATGQKITSYVQVLAGPRQPGKGDGPEEMHVIVLDNGRS